MMNPQHPNRDEQMHQQRDVLEGMGFIRQPAKQPPLAASAGSETVTYAHMCELIETMPPSWLGGILITVVLRCVSQNNPCRTTEDLLHFVGKIAADAKSPNTTRSATGGEVAP